MRLEEETVRKKGDSRAEAKVGASEEQSTKLLAFIPLKIVENY